MAAAKEITLKVNIDPSGAVSGAQALSGTQKDLLSEFGAVNRSLKGLQDAYSKGSAAVAKYNADAQVAINLLDSNAKAGTRFAEQIERMTRKNIDLLASIKSLNAEMSRKEAADRSAAASATANAQALGLSISHLERLKAAYAGGRTAIEAFNREKYIEQTVFASMAGKTQAEIQAIANDAAKHWDLTAAVKALENGLRGKEQAMEAAHAAALADNAAMDLAKQKTDAFVVSIQNEVARLQGLAAAYGGGRAGIAAFNLAQEIQNRQMRQGVSATSAAGQAIDQFTRQEYAARTAVDLLEKELKEKEKALRGVKPAADHATHGLTAFQTAVTTLATIALNKLRNEIVGARQSFDRMTNTFAVASNSSMEAAEKMSFLRGNASKLGLDIQSVGVSFAKFDVAAQNTSLSSKQVRDIFVSVSEATTAMGLSSEVAEGALLALQQMISKGTVQSEELRGQFAERIPGAFRLAAEAMGWTQLELAKNLEQGRVLSEDLLPKLAAKLHEVFGPGSVSGSKLLSAEINRLKNEWFDFLVQTSKDIHLSELIRLMSENFAALTFAAKTFLAVGLIVYFPVLAEKLAILAASFKAAAASANGFWVAMLGGEVGITAVIAAIIIAGYELNKAINDWKADSSAAMAGYVADGEKVNVQLSSIRDLYVELNKLNPFNQEGGTPNVTADMLKAINEEVSRTEEKLRSDTERLEQLKKKLNSGDINIAAGQYGAGQQGLIAEKAEYESLVGTTAALSESLKLLKDRQFDAQQEMFNSIGTSKVADDALNEYKKTVDEISIRYQKGLFAHLGGEDLNAAEQYAEYMRQLADARNAYDNAIAPGRAKAEAKSMREAAKEANEYTKELDRLIKKYDEKRYAEEAAIAAHALAEDAYSKERLGALNSAEALTNLNTVHENISATLQEKLHPGYESVSDDIKRFIVEINDSIDASERMIDAQSMSNDALLEAERNEAIYGKTKELVTKYKLLALSATEDESVAERDYREAMAASVETAKELAGIEFDRARSLGISESLRKATDELKRSIAAQHEYNKVVAQGPEALEEYVIQQEALAIAYQTGARTTKEMKDAVAVLLPYLRGLKEETKDGLGKKMIDDLKYETEWMNRYAEALKKGEGAVMAFNIQKQVADAVRDGRIGKDGVIEFEAALKASSLAKMRVDLAEITAQFKEDMWNALEGGLNTFFNELSEGNKDAVKNLGDNLQKTLLEAAAKWLSAMLVNIAKAAVAAQSIQGETSVGSGGGGFMGALKGMFGGGGGGASTGMYALGAWVAVAAAAVAILKHQSDRADAVRYNTSVNYNTHDSGVGSMYVGGKLMETGNKVAEAFRQIVEEVQGATGALLEGAHRAAITIRNDKKGFQAAVDGVILGTFKTVDEAIIAAVKKLFSAENLKNQIDPIVQQVINNFDTKKGGQAFSEAINAVTEIMNGLSGLTDIEVALRDLPAQTSQLASKLHEMGVAMGDAESVAERWRIQQFQSLRDQITGHQATEAEQRAEKERQAAMFNAELALTKANMALRKSDIESQLETLRARIDVTNTKYELDKWQLERERDFALQGAEIAQAELDVRAAAGQASIAMLEAQLAAINQSIAALNAIQPIDMREIRIPGGGGRGGGSTGPSEREQRATAFWDFMENQMLDGMGDVERALYELNKAFEEQEKAARELGQVEELEAARIAAISRMREDFLNGYRLENLSDYARAVEELNAAFADQAILNGELAGSEGELARVRREAMARLREDLLDSLGSPMESTRDKLNDLIQRFRDLDSANDDLASQLKNGEISVKEYEEAIAHSAQVQQEFNDQMAISLLGMASYFAESLGDEKRTAEIRARLAEFEYNLKLAEFELTLETAYAQHWINTELYLYLKEILDLAKENPPDFTLPDRGDIGGGGGDTGPNPLEDMLQALLRALDRLRAIMQTYTDFLLGLQTSELSPYSIESQYNMAQAEYERLLALAQAGDLNAMEALPAAAQAYLELAGQMFGTASAGYAEIFAGVNADMTEIMGDIQSILDMVPSQFQPMEEKLDTIAEILDNMYLLWMNFDTGGGGGGGWVPPEPEPNPQTLHEFFDAYGLDWDQLSGGELMNVNDMMRSIIEDSQVSSQEMTSFVAAMEAMLGMTPGSMTQAQINALRTWLYYQIGQGVVDPDAPDARGGRPGTTNDEIGPILSTNNYAAQMNRNLEIIASLTAKGIKESSSERQRRPRLTYAGYVGGRSRTGRAS